MSTTPLPPPDPAFAPTIDHGLRLLDAFEIHQTALTNKALAHRTGLSPATVSRMTDVLESKDLLAYDSTSRTYRLAASALTLGYPLLASLRRRRELLTEMKCFAASIDGSVSLGLRDRHRIVFIESTWGSTPSQPRTDLGAPLPLLQSAVGRAWLAAAQPNARAHALAAVGRHDPQAFHRWRSSVAAAQTEFRRHGFCSSIGDWRNDVHAVAAPIHGLLDDETLVVSCGLPAGRMSRQRLLGEVGPRLRDLACRVSLDAASIETDGHTPAVQVSTRHADPYSHARTLSRALDLLMMFSQAQPSLTHARLARELDLPGPIVVRLTHTLRTLGYLRQRHPRGPYAPGAATLALAYPLLSGIRVREIARPLMRQLSEYTGGAVSLGIQHRGSMVYIETAWLDDDRRTPPDIGAPLPVLNTAMGRAWLSAAPRDERQAVLNRIRINDPEHFARYAPLLDRASTQYRQDGYCASIREFRSDIVAFATTLSRLVDGMRVTLNCGLLAVGRRASSLEKRAAPALLDTARQIEFEIARRGDCVR